MSAPLISELTDLEWVITFRCNCLLSLTLFRSLVARPATLTCNTPTPKIQIYTQHAHGAARKHAFLASCLLILAVQIYQTIHLFSIPHVQNNKWCKLTQGKPFRCTIEDVQKYHQVHRLDSVYSDVSKLLICNWTQRAFRNFLGYQSCN